MFSKERCPRSIHESGSTMSSFKFTEAKLEEAIIELQEAEDGEPSVRILSDDIAEFPMFGKSGIENGKRVNEF